MVVAALAARINAPKMSISKENGMQQLFDAIYASLTLANLPGILSFEVAPGRPLDELVAHNDNCCGTGLAARRNAENSAGDSLDRK